MIEARPESETDFLGHATSTIMKRVNATDDHRAVPRQNLMLLRQRCHTARQIYQSIRTSSISTGNMRRRGIRMTAAIYR